MKHPAEHLQPPPMLDDLRAKAARNDAGACVDLAGALLEFSRALDRHYDFGRAFDAAREGIEVLARTEYPHSRDLTILMDALVAEYLSISHRSRMEPDRKLLAPIATALAHAAQP